MSHIFRLFLMASVLSTLVLNSNTKAEDPEQIHPTIRTVMKDADQFVADLKFLIDMTNDTEKKQWEVLTDYLNDFLTGIDRTQLIRSDLVIDAESYRYITSIPISDMSDFRESLRINGLHTRRYGSKDRFKFYKGFKGFMRHKEPYAIMAEKLDEIPVDIPNPQTDVLPLLEKGYNLALEGKNQDGGQEERHQFFQKTRNEVLAGLKQNEGESDDDFNLRKKIFEFQMDEAERLYAESRHLLVGGRIETGSKQGLVEMSLEPIPESPLAKTIEEIGKNQSKFIALPRSENSILSARVSHPLDDLRQKYLVELSQMFHDRAANKVDASEERSDEEKVAGKKALALLHELLDGATKSGIMDGFVEAHSNDSGQNTLVAGFRLPNAVKIVDVIKLLPEARKGREVQVDFDKTGEVQIHKVAVSTDDHLNFATFFGGKEVFIGQSADSVWLAAGENALEELKATIGQSKEATTTASGDFATIFIRTLPWVKLRHDRKQGKGEVEMREMALAAFELGNDVMEMSMQRKENLVTGQFNAHEGILRFVGKAIAKFSKENLDEVPPE